MKTALIGIIVMLQASVLFASTDPAVHELERLVSAVEPQDANKGIATYYAKRFEWRRTTSGEPYNPFRMTAAHATLPLGTVVSVANRSTSRSVVVRINDRCHPRHANKNLIDLSRSAALEIGLWGKGMTDVQITHLTDWHSEDDLLLQELVE